MEKSRGKSGSAGYRLMSVLLFTWGFLSLLGEFGVEGIGSSAYSLFKIIMGDFAWAGPFVSLLLAVFLWFSPSAPSTRTRRSSTRGNLGYDEAANVPQNVKSKSGPRPKQYEGDRDEGLSLPGGKLVSLDGFNKYFAEEELDISDPRRVEDITDLGRDFPTYFGEGEKVLTRTPARLTTLHGLKRYFEEVEQEFQPTDKADKADKAGKVGYADKDGLRYSGQIAGLANQLPEDFAQEWSGEIAAAEDQAVENTLPSVQYIGYGEKYPDEKYPEKKYPEKKYSEENQTEKSRNGLEPDIAAGVEVLPAALGVEVLSAATELSSAGAEVASTAAVPLRPVGEARPPVAWRLPDLTLLNSTPYVVVNHETESPKQLEKVLLDFGVKARIIRVTRGPVITRYELAPAPGVKISKIVNLADDIALALAARDVRIEAPIPGQSAIGIEVPNKQPRAVFFREVLETAAYRENTSILKTGLGKDIADQPIVGDLGKMPHLLVAGATGSGKSVCVTAIINSILFNATPDQVKFLMIDPKMVELNHYNGIPHLLAPVVTDPKKAAIALKWMVKEMENRYELFAAAGVRDIERYNKIKAEAGVDKPALPWMVVVIDELADLMLVAPADVEEAICRLAQMARAAGIHLVIATQRPSVDVITGVIKANIPSRISFAVSSQIDSRTILDAAGAEKLLGRGDMLYSPIGVNKPVRVQGCLVADEEVNRIIQHWKRQGRPEYLDPGSLFADTSGKAEEGSSPDDDLFVEAGRLLLSTGMASVSFLQRRLKLGYARAARLMDMLEDQGVVGPYEGTKPRQILLSMEEFEERFG